MREAYQSRPPMATAARRHGDSYRKRQGGRVWAGANRMNGLGMKNKRA
jgi:hypothetical protein